MFKSSFSHLTSKSCNFKLCQNSFSFHSFMQFCLRGKLEWQIATCNELIEATRWKFSSNFCAGCKIIFKRFYFPELILKEFHWFGTRSCRLEILVCQNSTFVWWLRLNILISKLMKIILIAIKLLFPRSTVSFSVESLQCPSSVFHKSFDLNVKTLLVCFYCTSMFEM